MIIIGEDGAFFAALGEGVIVVNVVGVHRRDEEERVNVLTELQRLADALRTRASLSFSVVIAFNLFVFWVFGVFFTFVRGCFVPLDCGVR